MDSVVLVFLCLSFCVSLSAESLPLEKWPPARLAVYESVHSHNEMRNIDWDRVLRVFEELAVTVEGKALRRALPSTVLQVLRCYSPQLRPCSMLAALAKGLV